MVRSAMVDAQPKSTVLGRNQAALNVAIELLQASEASHG